MNRSSFLALLSAISLFGAYAARAELLYDNGPPSLSNGFELTHWIEADDFTLNAVARLESVKFWSFEGAGSFEGSILWRIHANTESNTPGTVLFSGTSTNLTHVATGASYFGYAEHITTFDITPTILPAGTYWLALHNGPLTNDSVLGRVYWETTSTLGARESRSDISPFLGLWLSNSIPPGAPSECAFQLNGTLSGAASAVAVSRKTHGAAGDFDVDLPRTGPSGIECRSGGANGNYHMVVTFPSAVTFTGASLASGSGSVAGFGGSGTAVATVDLTSVTTEQHITVKLESVNDGVITTDVIIPMGVLVGDTNGNGFVNTGDSLQTRNRSGQAAESSNFRSDLNADGFINSGDTTAVRARSGTSLP